MMNMAPTPMLNDFRSYSAVELYGLLQEIYSSSDGMSELLEDKYPDTRRLEEDVEALYRLSRPYSDAQIRPEPSRTTRGWRGSASTTRCAIVCFGRVT